MEAPGGGEVPVTDDVAAVVTAFRPGPGLVELVRSLAAQTGRVIVVDDGSGPDADAVLDGAVAAGADVVRHDTNRGIAAALNTGVAAARAAFARAAGSAGHAEPAGTDPAAGATGPAAGHLAAVVTFDQDSTVDAGFIATLLATYRDAAGAGLRVGLVAPARVEGLPSPVSGYERGFVLGGTPIQSGLLIPVATLDRIGRFAEPLFIDGVDTDYALRTAAAGLVVLLAGGATLGHSLGERHPLTLFGRPLRLGGQPLSFVVSKPFRYYYLLRNRVLLNRMHGRRNRAWSIRETLGDLRHCAIVLAVAPGRMRRVTAMCAGLRDGWAGRTGRIPAALEARIAGR
ncbi:rhamnosyltransferase [Herbiconiux ginsengi]|uniref:Rhamnosyltransferase n=1 Tax=Herbiconiux ginsengi TaxID=381665 RepID=A0A1H3SU85_9MICO|nr:rhamnosyltransferase [Herbiconiux ginsengi]